MGDERVLELLRVHILLVHPEGPLADGMEVVLGVVRGMKLALRAKPLARLENRSQAAECGLARRIRDAVEHAAGGYREIGLQAVRVEDDPNDGRAGPAVHVLRAAGDGLPLESGLADLLDPLHRRRVHVRDGLECDPLSLDPDWLPLVEEEG